MKVVDIKKSFVEFWYKTENSPWPRFWNLKKKFWRLSFKNVARDLFTKVFELTFLFHHHYVSLNFGVSILNLRCCNLLFFQSVHQASWKCLKKRIRKESHHHVNAECYTWDTSLTCLNRFFTFFTIFLKLCQKTKLPIWHYFTTSKKLQTKTSTFATSTIVLLHKKQKDSNLTTSFFLSLTLSQRS